jgi:hypothetical protein
MRGTFVPVRMSEEEVRINHILMIDEAIRSGRFPAIHAVRLRGTGTLSAIATTGEKVRGMYGN